MTDPRTPVARLTIDVTASELDFLQCRAALIPSLADDDRGNTARLMNKLALAATASADGQDNAPHLAAESSGCADGGHPEPGAGKSTLPGPTIAVERPVTHPSPDGSQGSASSAGAVPVTGRSGADPDDDDPFAAWESMFAEPGPSRPAFCVGQDSGHLPGASPEPVSPFQGAIAAAALTIIGLSTVGLIWLGSWAAIEIIKAVR